MARPGERDETSERQEREREQRDRDDRSSSLSRRVKGDTFVTVVTGLIASGTFVFGGTQFRDMGLKFEAMQTTISRLESKLAVLEAAGFEGRVRELERLAAERGAQHLAIDARLASLERERK